MTHHALPEVLALALALAMPVVYGADAAPPASEPQSAGGAANYVPGLGEIMAGQQMRHAKLWFAGSNRNWSLAAYELDELREGFEDASKLHPVHENVPVAALIARLTEDPLAAIGKALDARSEAGFRKAFDRLTSACNACHKAANHGFIRIKRPAGAMYGNQVFAPTKGR